MEGELQDALDESVQLSAQLHGQMAAIQAQLKCLRHLMARQAEHVAALRQAIAVSHGHLRALRCFLEKDAPEDG